MFAVLAMAVASLVPTAAADAAPSGSANAHAGTHVRSLCATPKKADHAQCFGKQVVPNRPGKGGPPKPRSSQPAMWPNDLQTAYNLKTAIASLHASGAHPTVAIVDAYGYPTLESDLATYRSHFNLPACTTSNGCLTILDQRGGTSYPRTNTGWDQEQALDVDTVSAVCPDCHILVVQADSNSFANLGAAVQQAAAQAAAHGVVAISNSYGGGDASDATYGAYYNFPGIAVTASTGDSGYQGGSYPADSAYVTAVGGTSLYVDGANTAQVSYNHETAWSGSGSGCSSYNTEPSAAQTLLGSLTTCGTFRAMADVSAAADPYYGGMYVYMPSRKGSGWATVGGTSEASPIVASLFALSGSTFSGYSNDYVYANYAKADFHDPSTGSNGSCGTILCDATGGWDGPTGLGTPNGVGGF